MKRAILFCLVVGFSRSAFAATDVTVDQLNKQVIASKGKDDGKIAPLLTSLHLTERLSTAKLAAMEAALPGPESREALVILADKSAFLNLPAAEIPNNDPPRLDQQREMIAKTTEYVRQLQLQLPNLSAIRETIHFEDSPSGLQYGSLHAVSRSTHILSYQGGSDFVQIAGKDQPAALVLTRGLTSFGEFGPILSAVLLDLPQGKLAWSHWEQESAKPIAVFGFSVPQTASDYEVKFCCVGGIPFVQLTGYHGEITINPEDGAILRLTVLADLAKDDPITIADLTIEYSPIELDGRIYICPAKSITLSVAPSSPAGNESSRSGSVNGEQSDVAADAIKNTAMQTMLNEVHFDQYRVSHSESRVLMAGESSAPPSGADSKPAPEDSTSQVSGDGRAGTAASVPGKGERATEGAAAPSAESHLSIASGSSAPVFPEINVTPQKSPSIPDAPADQATFSLRVTSRIVDVSVAAFDKQGNPITELTPDDFEIYDGSRRQSLRSFSRAAAPVKSTIAAPSAAQPNVFSNRIDFESRDGQPQPKSPSTSESTTVIFFDSTSLVINDLTYARNQVIKILDTLPASEPVGIYVRIGLGFRVLIEGTTDRSALRAVLNAWKPNARDLAQAQESQERNHEHLDAQLSQSRTGVLLVDSNQGGGATIGADPTLLVPGREPTREALSALSAVATHMGVIPGHKNLVWVASDNVLSDWSGQASGDEGRMGPSSIGQYSIRTQEALNNAQVSLYPFDASQLDSNAFNASLANDGAQADLSRRNSNYTPPPGGREVVAMRMQTRTVQIAMQQLAESTGGRAFARSTNVISNLNRVIADSNAVYLLSFAPDTQPDDKYHEIKVTLRGRRDVKLRYRSGYLYARDPASLKDRFAKVLWQPFDASEIAITARRTSATGGSTVTLNIAAADIGLLQKDGRWTGKVDVFLVKRDDTRAAATVKEQTLALDLSSANHDRVIREGIPFQQYLDDKQKSESVRMIVVDEISGRMGSITLPPDAQEVRP